MSGSITRNVYTVNMAGPWHHFAMTTEEKGARVRVPPPLVFLALLLGGVGLQRLHPLLHGIAPLRWLGAALCVGALTMGIFARHWHKRTGQDPAPWKPSPELILRGPYKFSRNPMYAGMLLIQLGFGLALDNLWIVILGPLALAVVHFTAVLR